MLITLNWREIGDKSASGDVTIDVPAGKTLRIESSPGGEEVFSYETPAGKVINYFIRITAIESNE